MGWYAYSQMERVILMRYKCSGTFFFCCRDGAWEKERRRKIHTNRWDYIATIAIQNEWKMYEKIIEIVITIITVEELLLYFSCVVAIVDGNVECERTKNSTNTGWFEIGWYWQWSAPVPIVKPLSSDNASKDRKWP